MGNTSATRVALAPAFVPCENNRNVTFWSERAWVRTPPVRSRAPSTRAPRRALRTRAEAHVLTERSSSQESFTCQYVIRIKVFFAYHFTTFRGHDYRRRLTDWMEDERIRKTTIHLRFF